MTARTAAGLADGAACAAARALLSACALALAAAPLPAQVVGRPAEELPEPVDSADVQGRARREQARFERRRRRLLPLARSTSGGSDCDETVGRFCLWFSEGDWTPEPEPPELGSLRDDLIAHLDSVQALIPTDGWVLGQRVWYRGEAGRWAEALEEARACGAAEPWWCAALEGLALHGLGRFEDAGRAFERALAGMEPEEARRWRTPRRAVRGGVRDALEDGEDGDGAGSEALDRFWMLADPFFLVPGNDRLTEHFSRWTVARIRERARNPYQISWGRDLEELLVRFGWEIGWERGRSWDLSSDVVVGHQHPEGRDFLPREPAVRDPAAAAEEAFEPGHLRPRSLYAPVYAPVVLPMDGQVAAFPRVDRVLVVATAYVPEDTTRRSGDDRPRPWMEPGDQAGRPDGTGLFLVPAAGDGPVRGTTRSGEIAGALALEVPAGGWVVSVEAWRPPARLAGRTRIGLRRDSVPRDVATLSDLLLVAAEAVEPGDLDQAIRRALPSRVLAPGERLGVVWELNGLGWEPATVTYDLSLEDAEPGFFRRLGQGLGLTGPERPLELSWEEPGPERPVTAYRHLALRLPDVDPGVYRLRLRARVTGRSTLTSETEVAIRPPH